jgi:release factor glutamine methyltransferase
MAQSSLIEYGRSVHQRSQGTPLQYLTEHQEFYGLDFWVTPDVLIPRPETEFIVEAVLKWNRREAPLIIDVGTGSGCLAVTLAAKLARARIIALDISTPALAVARRNAERHCVGERIEFLQSDMFSALDHRESLVESAICVGTPHKARTDHGRDARATFMGADFIVANPPYISEAELPVLAREVREHEPLTALVAGADGMAVQKRILAESRRFLRDDGLLVVEIAYGQFLAFADAARSFGWQLVEVIKDLQGIQRTVVLCPRFETTALAVASKSNVGSAQPSGGARIETDRGRRYVEWKKLVCFARS